MGIGKIINKLKKPKEDDRPVDEAKDGATLSDFKKVWQ